MKVQIKHNFPIFTTHPDLVYLDSASTSQKPAAVIDAVTHFYKKKNANIHRGIYALAEAATEAYEHTRDTTAAFINAANWNEIIFTGNTNQAINLVAEGWGRKFLKPGDKVILTEMEHHANIVPWLRLKEEIGIELLFAPINEEGKLGHFFLTDDIKLVALTHISNVLGTINPVKDIIKDLKRQNPDIKVLIDAAQSVAHIPLDVQDLNCDFLAFSSHKMLGPAGVGVLWAKEELLEEMNPVMVGSHMIKRVTKKTVTYAKQPDKFEVGTGNLEGVVGLGAAITYLHSIGMENVEAYDKELTQYALKKLKRIPYLTLYGPTTAEDRVGIFSFGIKNAHPHDIAQILDAKNIAIRSGHHCCQVLMDELGVQATARASLYIYNTKTDVDRLIDGIAHVKKILKI